MYCSNCGNRLHDGGKYCANCGAAVMINVKTDNLERAHIKSVLPKIKGRFLKPSFFITVLPARRSLLYGYLCRNRDEYLK